jgi:hypothetical protein
METKSAATKYSLQPSANSLQFEMLSSEFVADFADQSVQN